MMRNRKKSRAGVTLIEVLLATVILSAGITTLVLAATRALAVARKAKEYETARRLIGQVDLEIPPNFEEIEEDTETGNFDRPFSDYSWEREITEMEDEELKMFIVRTAVFWSNKGQEKSEEVVTYIYGPSHPRQTGGP
jgi:type II secretory pathway component PulJ